MISSHNKSNQRDDLEGGQRSKSRRARLAMIARAERSLFAGRFERIIHDSPELCTRTFESSRVIPRERLARRLLILSHIRARVCRAFLISLRWKEFAQKRQARANEITVHRLNGSKVSNSSPIAWQLNNQARAC